MPIVYFHRLGDKLCAIFQEKYTFYVNFPVADSLPHVTISLSLTACLMLRFPCRWQLASCYDFPVADSLPHVTYDRIVQWILTKACFAVWTMFYDWFWYYGVSRAEISRVPLWHPWAEFFKGKNKMAARYFKVKYVFFNKWSQEQV